MLLWISGYGTREAVSAAVAIDNFVLALSDNAPPERLLFRTSGWSARVESEFKITERGDRSQAHSGGERFSPDRSASSTGHLLRDAGE